MKESITTILLAIACIMGYAQTIDPVLLQEMGQRTDDEKIKVVVIMKSQYDRQQLGRRAAHYVTRADRREFVVNELKQFAEASQHELRSTLSEMERQDMTTAPKVIWMANALYFSATKQAINDLAQRRDIELIGLDEKKQVLFDEEPRPANMTREITSNVSQVNADQVWNLGYTGQGVVVAVIDSGVNYNHLDLADHLWDGGSEYPFHGYDFYNEDNNPMDDHGHGTHCAGTVCGDGTAGSQTGMAPDATLMCVKVLDAGGYSTAAITCDGMQWAVEQGCDLFSMSLGWTSPTLTERTLFRNTCAAILDAGVVGAIAAGNNGNPFLFDPPVPIPPIPNNVGTPGSCPPPYMDPVQAGNSGDLSCSICVGAVDVYDEAAYFTSVGPVTWLDTEFGDYPYTAGSSTEFGLIRPDVCAPGVDVVSADYFNNSGYTIMSGTSMATPCVAGCISLMLSKNINITPAEICQILEETAVPLAAGKSNVFGYGRVDALAAINALSLGSLALESFAVNDEQGNNDGKLNAGETVTLDLSLMNNSDIVLDGATMVLSTESEFVTITNGTATLPHFDAGQTQNIENIFGFILSNDATGNRPILFKAETFIDGEFYAAIRISVMVYGYDLRFEEVTVLNDNNGNGVLEAGETANLHVVISNMGNEQANSVVGTLSTIYPYLTINDAVATFGNIDVNGQASADYNVTLSDNAPDIYIIDFSIDFVDDNEQQSTLDFELVEGFIVFADANVKSICVSHWDTNSDGELSYDEAAAVTRLDNCFIDNDEIVLFDELQYFTGLSSIDSSAFLFCTKLKSVVMPSSISSIETWAFWGCYSLTSPLTIPNSVTSIGGGAFGLCFGLTGALTIPNSVTSIGSSAFYYCDGLTTLIIGNSVTTIGDGVFEGCSGLNAVYYTGNVNQWCNIQFGAVSNPLNYAHNLFINNELVTDLVIPETVTEIKYCAFEGATCLTSLTIPNSITSIGYDAFRDCSGLNAVYYTGDVYQWCNIQFNGYWAPNPLYYAHKLFINNELVTNLVIPETVTEIKPYTFDGASCITSLIIPNSVTSIGSGAFSGCHNIYFITSFCETPPTLGYGAFGYNGSTLSSNTVVCVPCGFEEAYTSVSWGGFSNFYGMCGGTVSVSVDSGEGGMVTGGGTFEAGQTCTVTATAFEGYDFASWSLNGTVVSNSAEFTFHVGGDMALVARFVPIGNIVFADAKVKEICITHWDFNGDGELSYAEAASIAHLSNCFFGSEITSFDELQYFIGLSSICDEAFYYCKNLTSISLPNSITSIGRDAFDDCQNLFFITSLAETPPEIENNYIGYLSSNTTVCVPCGFEEAYSSIPWGGFSNFYGMCGGTVSVSVDPEEGGMVTGGGAFEAGQTCTVTATAFEGYAFANWTMNGNIVSITSEYTFHVGGDMALVAKFVPAGNIRFADANVKSICVSNWDFNGDGELSYAEAASILDLGYSFYQNSDITSFNELQYFIGLSSIGQNAFNQCYYLTSITLPNSITSIDFRAFYKCHNLTSIALPNSITSIDESAFTECMRLTSITLPNSVTSIGNYAFSACIGLTAVYFMGNVSQWCNIQFDGNYNGYNSEISNPLYYAHNLFIDNELVTDLVIPDTVTMIKNYAFLGATCLTSLTIPNSVTSIGKFAFYGCSGLNAVYYTSDINQWCNTQFDGFSSNPLYYAHNLFIDNELVTELVIPETVTMIKKYAFIGATCISSITIANSVASIGEFAFYNCSGLMGLLTIPNSVTLIEKYAFYNCNELSALIIGNSIISIVYNAFSNCTSLETITVLAVRPPTTLNEIFQNVNNSIPVYVPCGSVSAYQSKTYWNQFTNIQEGWYDIIVSTNLDEGGSATGDGNYCLGSTCTLIATANVGYTFVNWTKDDEIVSTEAEYSFIVAENATYMANFVENYTQNIGLSEGWNWCSFNVEITLDDLKAALVEALPGTAISIKSQTQNTSYNPNNNRWVGSLAWDVSKMYKISVTAACEIMLIGLPINPSEHSISIMNGANWIGFPHNSSMTLANAFAGFAVNGDRIKSQTNNALYNGIRWQGQLNALESGKGYIYISNSLEERTLTFPTIAK